MGPPSRNLKLTVEYDGTAYFGWQLQVGLPTIQGVLEEVLAPILDHPVRVVGAGRTDRGVHALGQVAGCRTSSRIPAGRLVLAANSRLPEDIVLREAVDVPPEFHPRWSATGKWYRYSILNRRIPQVRDRHF
ncbi:MAG: tRNA pseudouridine(38-40) synthase TruA, partial [Planctomycetes bacterium]|nr:tRNA pseudouridine(38-40) synthase TruA [Planctomycetota bacterium]